MKKLFISLLVVLIAALGVYSYVNYFSPKPQINKTQTSYTVYQLINNNNTIHQLPQKQTALVLLQKTHKITISGEGVNAFVTSIDGLVADSIKKQFWAFYINGKQAMVGAGSYYLQPNDKIEWKIETY
jgi:hypothetical protein